MTEVVTSSMLQHLMSELVVGTTIPRPKHKHQVCPFEGHLCCVGLRECWIKIQEEAISLASSEPFLARTLTNSIITHTCFGSSISYVLSQVLSKSTAPDIGFDDWYNLLYELYTSEEIYDPLFKTMSLECMGMFDLLSIIDRDPAADGLLVNPFLNFKGYKALQMHRVAHVLWRTGRQGMAELIQSKCSDAFAIDIHPAARIDRGLMIDHGTGVVIGETTVIGKNCAFLHGVTLGATGKDHSDRHPKIGEYVLIGCNATVLGNISIGSNVKIGASSVVLKSLPAGVTAVGSPARIVGASSAPPTAAAKQLLLSAGSTSTTAHSSSSSSSSAGNEHPSLEMDHALQHVVDSRGVRFLSKHDLWESVAEEQAYSHEHKKAAL